MRSGSHFEEVWSESRQAQATFVPDKATVDGSQLTDFIGYCEDATGHVFGDFGTFDRFCVEDFRTFWRLFVRWSALLPEDEIDPVCVGESCEGARFFPRGRLNYADMLLSGEPDRPAITVCHRDGERERLTRGELRTNVIRLAGALWQLGVRPGDRVVAIARNNAEVAVGALAAAAIGAAFSSCGVEMGSFAILRRFARLGPVVLLANLQSQPWEHGISLAVRVAEVVAGLPSLNAIVALDGGSISVQARMPPTYLFSELTACASGAPVSFARSAFDHPLFILFSSGTTGMPKCIVHGAGGTLLEHAKEHRLHCDLKAGDKLFFQTSPGWMMWNWQLSALAAKVELVSYDGPLRGPETLWSIVADEGVTVFGTSAAYLQYCESSGISPGKHADFGSLRGVLSTGSILYPRQYDWLRDHVKPLPLQSISGGTDIIGCFVLGNPNLPVRRGEAQCRSLGLDVRSLRLQPDDPVGELVCANPFPSRPIGFFGDPDGRHYHDAYFRQHPGVWTHGDLIEFTASGGAILHGRSDGVLNVRGVRVGPAEIYAILQNIEEITEALAVEQSAPDEAGGTRLILLVVLGHGFVLDQQLSARIRTELTTRGSAALVPARIAQVDELPVTYSGKRSEAAVRDVLNGRQITNVDALQNPQCLTAIANSLSLQDQSGSAGPPCADDRQADREEDLKRICEETLGVSSLRPSDDFLALGGDSLTILKLFSKIKERTRYDLPLEAFVAARTIENLAALVGIGASRGPSPQQIPRGEPHVRPMSPADIDAVCRFLEGAFPGNSISASGWKALFQAGWFPAQRQLGFLLVVGNDVVGFIATIYSHREINGRSGLICNCSSWYVVPDYRAWSVSLLAAALADAKVTYTALTPIPLAVQTLQYLGFTRLGEGKIFCAPMMHGETLRERAPLICFDAENVRRSLTDRERQIFDDHAAYDCLQVLLRDEDAYAFLVVKRRRRRIPVSEVIHCGNASLLSRHLERAKLAILRRQRTFGLIVDERLFSTPPRGIKIKDDALYRSHTFLAADLDGLYSELVLLPV